MKTIFIPHMAKFSCLHNYISIYDYLLCYFACSYESLILSIRFDVGLVDVVIFDCYVLRVQIL